MVDVLNGDVWMEGCASVGGWERVRRRREEWSETGKEQSSNVRSDRMVVTVMSVLLAAWGVRAVRSIGSGRVGSVRLG